MLSACFFVKQKLQNFAEARHRTDSCTVVGELLFYKLNNSNCRKTTSELLTPLAGLSWAPSRRCPSV